MRPNLPIFVDNPGETYAPEPPQPDMMLGDMLFQAITQGVSLETTTIPASYDDDETSAVDMLGNPRTSNFDVFEASYSEKATKAMSDRLAATKFVKSPENGLKSDSPDPGSSTSPSN